MSTEVISMEAWLRNYISAETKNIETSLVTLKQQSDNTFDGMSQSLDKTTSRADRLKAAVAELRANSPINSQAVQDIEGMAGSMERVGKSTDAASQYMTSFESRAKRMIMGYIGISAIVKEFNAIKTGLEGDTESAQKFAEAQDKIQTAIISHFAQDYKDLADVIGSNSNSIAEGVGNFANSLLLIPRLILAGALGFTGLMAGWAGAKNEAKAYGDEAMRVLKEQGLFGGDAQEIATKKHLTEMQKAWKEYEKAKADSESDGRKKELADLEIWYTDIKKKDATNHDALLIDEETYQKKKETIVSKYNKKAIEENEQQLKLLHEHGFVGANESINQPANIKAQMDSPEIKIEQDETKRIQQENDLRKRNYQQYYTDILKQHMDELKDGSGAEAQAAQDEIDQKRKLTQEEKQFAAQSLQSALGTITQLENANQASAEVRRDTAESEAFINMAQSILKTNATLGFPAALPFDAIATAEGIAQMQIISQQKFAHGTSYAPGGLSLVGEKGPELMNVPRGSQIYNNSETRSIMSQNSGNTHIHVHLPPGASTERSSLHAFATQVAEALKYGKSKGISALKDYENAR